MPLRRPCALVALSTSIALTTTACPARQLAKVPIDAEVEERTNLPLDDNRDIDILFVVDNSDSMETEQGALIEEFPKIIDTIRASANQPSVHFGVISTNVGGGNVGGCQGDGDDGLLQTGDPACNAINDGSNFIFDVANEDGSRTTNYDGELRDAFACMAELGINGCGFEAPLESLKRAIDNPANANFFRDDAYLAVVFITDEDDCSLRNSDLLADNGDRTAAAIQSQLGPLNSFRCFEFGVTCDLQGDIRDPGIREDCIPREDSPYVADITSYIEHVRGSKRFPTQIFVAAIAGDLEPLEVEYRPSNIFDIPIPQLKHSCSMTGLGEAVPPLRLNAFLNAFEGRSDLVSICDDDLTTAVEEIATFIDRIVGPPCIQGVLEDTDATTPGLQPECVIVEVTDPDLPSEQERVLEACDNQTDPQASSNLPCFHMYENPECNDHPTGLAVDVIYPDGFTVAPFTQAEISCIGVAPL